MGMANWASVSMLLAVATASRSSRLQITSIYEGVSASMMTIGSLTILGEFVATCHHEVVENSLAVHRHEVRRLQRRLLCKLNGYETQ